MSGFAKVRATGWEGFNVNVAVRQGYGLLVILVKLVPDYKEISCQDKYINWNGTDQYICGNCGHNILVEALQLVDNITQEIGQIINQGKSKYARVIKKIHYQHIR